MHHGNSAVAQKLIFIVEMLDLIICHKVGQNHITMYRTHYIDLEPISRHSAVCIHIKRHSRWRQVVETALAVLCAAHGVAVYSNDNE